MTYRIIIFLVLNFLALAIGGAFTGDGVPSDWYIHLSKAPWTPPGWVFGAAWTTIMVAFSVYMTYLWGATDNKRFLIGIYALQWVLNVGWNPTFFHFHYTLAALLLIAGLTLLITFFLFSYWSLLQNKSLLILPYFVWLLIATSLNAYICLYN